MKSIMLWSQLDGDKQKTRMATACPTGLCETPGAQIGAKKATSGSNEGEYVKLER